MTLAFFLQMLGFVWGVVVERFQHKDLFEQVQSSPVLIAAVIALITVASAVPFYRGARRSGNPIFTADAELWNGRLAMVGCPDFPLPFACVLTSCASVCLLSNYCSYLQLNQLQVQSA